MARKKQKTLETTFVEIGVTLLVTLFLSHVRAYAVKRTNKAFDKANEFTDYEEIKP